MGQGKVHIEEVPAPTPEPGYSLVRVSHSCISTGTELSGMKSSGMPLWKRALKNPDKVRQVLTLLATRGFSKTKSIVQGKLASGSPTGYSAAGVDYVTGRRVACAGAQFANHSEFIQVPQNLIVPIPDNLDFPEASTVALGAIALQGIRRAQPTLGETFLVIGLGFLGQLTCQMLQVNGCRVFGLDLDPHRAQLAKVPCPSPEDLLRLTDNHGVDGVIITAATSSSEVLSNAFKLTRKKGRVVLVGDVGLNLKRSDFYQKEIDFLISTSYGPGRYDDRYEEKGLDYPIGYVRWTENRNMAEYLKLLSEKKLAIAHLIHQIYPIEKVTEAYTDLNELQPRPLLALLSYPQNQAPTRTYLHPHPLTPFPQQIQIALIGAGGFAKGMHLPNLQSLKEKYYLKAIVSRSGYNAKATAKQFNAAISSTDYREILQNRDLNAVIIATRHDLHAPMVLDALRAGKHVLAEKPLALNREELKAIETFYAQTPHAPLLLTGFNRRFSTYAQSIYQAIQNRTHPILINYRMNAGYIPLDHWVHGSEGGGRNIGEACHIYDLFTYFTQSEVVQVQVQALKPTTQYYSHTDNFIATLAFKDGSIATLTYTALGSKEHPKEQMELFCDGKVHVIDDYRTSSSIPEKGQKEELIAFANAIQGGGAWPIPLWQQLQAMEIAFKVEDHLHQM